MAQRSYDYRIQRRNNDIIILRPYLNDNLAKSLAGASRGNTHRDLLNNDPFSSRATLLDSASVTSASTTPNNDARSILLRVELKQGDQDWRDEVLAVCGSQCRVIDDIRYLSGSAYVPAGALRQSIENR